MLSLVTGKIARFAIVAILPASMGLTFATSTYAAQPSTATAANRSPITCNDDGPGVGGGYLTDDGPGNGGGYGKVACNDDGPGLGGGYGKLAGQPGSTICNDDGPGLGGGY